MESDSQEYTSEKRKPSRWEKAFLAALSTCGNVSKAAEAAKVSRKAAYNLRNADLDFALAWEDALQQCADSLEGEAIRRARDGVNEPVIYQGELKGIWVKDGERVTAGTEGATLEPLTIKKYSDTLLIFMLKGFRPAKFRDNVAVEHSGETTHNVRGKHEHTVDPAALRLFAHDLAAAGLADLPTNRNGKPVDS